VRDKLKT